MLPDCGTEKHPVDYSPIGITMFNNLSNKLTQVLNNLAGRGRLTEDNIQETLNEVQNALLEADVALPVAQSFIEAVRQKAIGTAVINSLKPAEMMVKIVYDELVSLMGESCAELNLRTQKPAIILMAGLQGSGKTTTAVKLAYFLKEVQKKTVMVTSTDIYRPAAITQLEILASEAAVHYHPSHSDQTPMAIVESAIAAAKVQFVDVLIIDTAGRLHIDQEMMHELAQLHHACNPVETLFVVDSMTGQDAVNTAKVFNDQLPLTGIILTKTDGDARGGAALSVRSITHKPIKFMGVGEKISALEAFHPERVASRILGMGDVLTLVEEVKRKTDQGEAERLAKKLKQGKSFDLQDFLKQLEQMRKMGGVAMLMGKLPGMGQIPQAAKDSINDKMFITMEAIINSMTPKERRFPDLINGSRKRRIAAGSGTQVPDINRLLKQFTQMQKMMKKMGNSKILKGLFGG